MKERTINISGEKFRIDSHGTVTREDGNEYGVASNIGGKWSFVKWFPDAAMYTDLVSGSEVSCKSAENLLITAREYNSLVEAIEDCYKGKPIGTTYLSKSEIATKYKVSIGTIQRAMAAHKLVPDRDATIANGRAYMFDETLVRRWLDSRTPLFRLISMLEFPNLKTTKEG